MKLLDNLRSASSNYQKEILLAGITYEQWQTFVYAYHPDSIYHMKFKDFDIDNLGEPSEEMFTTLNNILDKRISGNAAKTIVESFAEEHGDLIKLICNKDLRCGVTATTFNKIHKGSIPQFKVQLAKEVPVDQVEYPCLAQLKYDGVRLIAIVSEDGVLFKTRNGKIVDLPQLAETISNISAVNYILDGEIVYGDGKQEGRTSISGAINSAMHGGKVDESAFVFHVFDTMAKLEWEAAECNSAYVDRFTILQGLVVAANSESIQVATTNEVHNATGAQQLYDSALLLGYEGLILKPYKHKYTFKRSKDWVKLKEVKSADLTCSNIEEGSGKYIGAVGALVCHGTVEGKEVKVNVGSGLSDFDRHLPWKEYIGQTIEIKYNSLIKDSVSGEWSLFLPRFVKVRIDK